MNDRDTKRAGATPITAQQIKALKNADTVCFDWRDGAYQIRAEKDGEHTADGFPQTVRINCDGQVRSYAGNEFGSTWNGFAYASESFMFPQNHECWQTALSFLRAGDVLSLVWIASNTSQAMQEVGFEHDELRLVVVRGEKTFTFSLAHSFTSAASTARMIRDHAW